MPVSEELPSNLKVVDPQPYLEFNYLVKNAKAVITDSGGITEETTVMGVPCLTLRDSTERPETITQGTNELIGTDPAKLEPALDRLFAGQWKKGGIPEKMGWEDRGSVSCERLSDSAWSKRSHGNKLNYLLLLFHTVRHLRFEQIFYRLYYGFCRCWVRRKAMLTLPQLEGGHGTGNGEPR